MKNKLFLLILLIFLVQIKGFAYDFYPEESIEPFYSELNPTFVNKEETATSEFELKKFIKNKINDFKIKRAEKRSAKKLKNLEEDKNFVSAKKKPKKHLTKAQLERELNKEEREKEKALQKQKEMAQNLTLREKIFNIKKDENDIKPTQTSAAKNGNTYVPPNNPNINISADYMEYYPDTYEIHAKGNAKVVFIAQNVKIEADKVVFDYDKNILKANENVILTSNGTTTEGDFLKLDLSKPSGWLENPVTVNEDIKISAKDAFIYSDNITEYDGVAKILKDEMISVGGRSFSSYVDQSGVLSDKNPDLSSDNKNIYKIKTDTIIIDAKDDHEIITVKNAGLYLKNAKIAVVPSLKIITNKSHNNTETNLPEFGSQSMLGMHFGPAVVLSVPGGRALKLAPILTYGDNDFGIGGIAKYRSETNMTQFAYGTSKEEFILRGRQKILPGLSLNYSRYSNMSEWFLGYRMPKYSTELNYSRSDYVKDLDLTFSQMYSAGLFVDNKKHYDLSNNHTRLRWMTQTYKPVYSYKNKEGNISFKLGLVAQTSASVYSQGNTAALVRFGPALSTKAGRWSQSVMYYLTGQAGESPFNFDRYRYGKSNVVLVESLNICKYLSVGYLASLSMHNPYHRDYHHDDLLQENRFFASVGSEYLKLTLGYDAVRHNTMMFITMLIGTKNSDIQFKKAVINNPDKIGKEKSKHKKVKKKSYRDYKKELKKNNQ